MTANPKEFINTPRAKAMIAWIREHGSERLRKAVRAHLAHTMITVYVEERLAKAYPELVAAGWRSGGSGYLNPHNAPEDALDRLLEVRAFFPDAQLKFAGEKHRYAIVATPFGFPIEYVFVSMLKVAAGQR